MKSKQALSAFNLKLQRPGGLSVREGTIRITAVDEYKISYFVVWIDKPNLETVAIYGGA